VYKTIRQHGGWENWEMVLVEAFPCENNLQAAARERFWYENLKANMNCQVPNQTKKEWEIQNQDKNAEYQTEYRDTNKDKIKEYAAKYYAENQDKIKKEIDCKCGGKYQNMSKARHFRSKMHLNFILTNNNDPDGQTDTED